VRLNALGKVKKVFGAQKKAAPGFPAPAQSKM
jgi:hypothetical protein